MSNDHDTPQITKTFHQEKFPWQGIFGYILSLVLTAFSLWFGLAHAAQYGVILYVIMGLAIMQIFVQMFMFMHVTETDEGFPWQSLGLVSGLVFVAAIVIMSIWIMTFGAGVS
ncbi:MAG: cytochrome C oxidase subunit IV family protein [Firmicutes bacterium]|nr:cytochrome C oxidase subunit IV family protein [Bacillota bacterium]